MGNNLTQLENDLHKYSSKATIYKLIVFICIALMFFNLIFLLVVIIAFIFYLSNYLKAKNIKKQISQINFKDDSTNKINPNKFIYNNINEEVYSGANIKKEKKEKKEDPEDIYIKSFNNIKHYNFNLNLDPKFIKSITRNNEVSYEAYMKYINTTKKPSNFVVFDLETTGLNELNNEIIQMGAIKFEHEEPVEIFVTYIKPNKKITQRITSINGITNEMVANAPTIEEILPRFLDFISDEVLVAHNSPFDMKFLLHNLHKYGYKKPKNKAIDTLKMSRNKIKEYDCFKEKDVKLESYKLEELKWRFGLDDLDSHEALSDCKVCAFIYLEMINEFDVCYPKF